MSDNLKDIETVEAASLEDGEHDVIKPHSVWGNASCQGMTLEWVLLIRSRHDQLKAVPRPTSAHLVTLLVRPCFRVFSTVQCVLSCCVAVTTLCSQLQSLDWRNAFQHSALLVFGSLTAVSLTLQFSRCFATVAAVCLELGVWWTVWGAVRHRLSILFSCSLVEGSRLSSPLTGRVEILNHSKRTNWSQHTTATAQPVRLVSLVQPDPSHTNGY